jgi:hypothetical protein
MPEVETVEGVYLFGFVRAVGSWEILRRKEDAGRSLLRIAYRDVAAIVTPAEYAEPNIDANSIVSHHRVIDETMRMETVLPAPLGVVFRDRKALLKFMRTEYETLDQGLTHVEGHWEVRIQMDPPEGLVALPEHREAASRAYSELKRFARSAVPFRVPDGRVFGAAFLVDRDHMAGFVERAEAVEASLDAALSFDITWPWPPYDFVRLAT